jgi:hypothetical protein
MKDLEGTVSLTCAETGLRVPLEWSAKHLRDQTRPIGSWDEVHQLLRHVGTTGWPWLWVQGVGPAHRRRRATCTGFADVLTVDVCAWGGAGVGRRVRRLGIGPTDDRRIDVGPFGDRCPRVRRSQSLSLRSAARAFRNLLELGQVDGFTCEEI